MNGSVFRKKKKKEKKGKEKKKGRGTRKKGKQIWSVLQVERTVVLFFVWNYR